MGTERSVIAVGVAALLFAAWELIDHAFLMQMEMHPLKRKGKSR